MLGANDSKPENWQFKANFISNFKEMINAYQNLSSHPKIFLNIEAKVYGTGNFGITDSVVQEVNALIVQIAKDTALPIIDVYTATSGMPQNFPDNIHLNDAAAQAAANVVYTTLINFTDTGTTI
jgi:lysophospholipase L1-like esterase